MDRVDAFFVSADHGAGITQHWKVPLLTNCPNDVSWFSPVSRQGRRVLACHSVAHQDLKPANVFIDGDTCPSIGRFRRSDFIDL